ncbi:TetR/AcrR family transcriptional regulator [Oceanobacillus piezotolerans]|uniref:TetR/AcrR family transcriptional regulator n=1 Tax=Oceanobacillus piezotolerans TaxID=2448030 RepID=A0A498DCM4_9BACI|nr:TetR/AcrR family transcriptional regulator [Oceanobacillus piezotolerans]RLL43901.1 TetR/AcrR family transcriptional regulator [Oceanobacillus piezotolerans]
MIEQLSTPRKNRTKEHFQLALTDLTKQKGFHSVTVKDIVDKAKYNRSTFYTHYQDKYELAEDLLCSLLDGLMEAVGEPYQLKQKVNTDHLTAKSFNIISYIYENRNFFELITYQDTIPDLHTRFPETILKIYQEKFEFETINHLPVDMDYFKRYTAYGFFGLLSNWISTGFETSQEEFIEEVIRLSRTHIAAVRFVGER